MAGRRGRRGLHVAWLVAVVLAAGLVLPAEPGYAKGNPTRIVSGPGIVRPLEIPFPDGWLEWSERYAGTIEPLPAPPNGLGEPVLVWSEAWAELPGRATDDLSSDIDPFDGRYWPGLGVVSVETASGVPAWYELDPERREVLDRYVRLAGLGALSQSPTPVAVALAGWLHLGEPVPFEVRIEHEVLPVGATEELLTQLAGAGTRDVMPAEFDPAATNFGPWEGHVWPLDVTGRGQNPLVQFCPVDGDCDGWRLMADEGLLVKVQVGSPSWSAFVIDDELRQFVEDHARSAREARDAEQQPRAASTTAGSTAGSMPPSLPLWLGAFAVGAVGVIVVVRMRRGGGDLGG